MWHDSVVLQVFQSLEGPADIVRSLFGKIVSDSRHTNVCLVSEEIIQPDDR